METMRYEIGGNVSQRSGGWIGAAIRHRHGSDRWLINRIISLRFTTSYIRSNISFKEKIESHSNYQGTDLFRFLQKIEKI